MSRPEKKSDRTFSGCPYHYRGAGKMRALFAAHLEDMRSLLIVSQLQLAEEKDIASPFKSEESKA